jgi:predicted dinucleotide-binding enzyme
MKTGVLGTAMVGESISSKLVELGHEVKMGSRETGNEKAVAWVKKAGPSASQGSFTDAARHGEVVFNCTRGVVSVEVVQAAGTESLRGKILIDVANALDLEHREYWRFATLTLWESGFKGLCPKPRW